MQRGQRIRGAELSLLVAATLASFVIAEVAIRLYAAASAQRHLDEALAHPPPIPVTGEVGLVQILQPNRNPLLVYELKPNLSVSFGARGLFNPLPLKTNAAGFRDVARSTEKAPGTYRIVGIGDSIMFGWGVADGEPYLAVLERELNARHPQHRWEAINTAVPGYNTVMEVETLAVKGLRYAPDLVLVGYCANDLDLPNFLLPTPDVWSWQRSFLFEFLQDRATLLGPAAPDTAPRGLRPAPLDAAGRHVPERASAQSRTLVGEVPFAQALERLRALAAANEFPVAFVTFFPGEGEWLAPHIDPLGFDLVDAWPEARRTLRGAPLAGSPLAVSATDGHPSALGQRLIADELLDYLETRLIAAAD